MSVFDDVHRRSIEDRDGFWSEQAKLIDWHETPQQICDYSQPPFARWFVGGRTNLCHNAVDRHAAAHPDRAALIWVSTEVDREQTWTFGELQTEVDRTGAVRNVRVLRGCGNATLDQLAVNAVKTCFAFRPAEVDGEKVDSLKRHKIVFELYD